MLNSRRQAREAALRTLYEIEVGKSRMRDAITGMHENADIPPDLKEFAEMLVRGVFDNQALLDDRLAALILDWDFERIAIVDKNLLRVAAYELLFCPSIPPAVTINEAIEIGKKYSTAESGRFIHGVLGKLAENSPKANWVPPPLEDQEAVEEIGLPEAEPEIESITEDMPEAKELSRIGLWKIKADDK